MSKVVEVEEEVEEEVVGRRREVDVQTVLIVGNWHFFLAEDSNHTSSEISSSRRLLVYFNPTEVPGSVII